MPRNPGLNDGIPLGFKQSAEKMWVMTSHEWLGYFQGENGLFRAKWPKAAKNPGFLTKNPGSLAQNPGSFPWRSGFLGWRSGSQGQKPGKLDGKFRLARRDPRVPRRDPGTVTRSSGMRQPQRGCITQPRVASAVRATLGTRCENETTLKELHHAARGMDATPSKLKTILRTPPRVALPRNPGLSSRCAMPNGRRVSRKS